MAATIIDSTLFGDVFSTAAMRDVWSDENRVAQYLAFEAALAKVQGVFGVIPAEAAAEIERVCRGDSIDMTLLKAQTERAGTPIVGLVAQINDLCRDGLGQYSHWGATTQDVTDTATVLQIAAALALVDADLQAIGDGLAVLAELRKQLARDRTKLTVSGFTQLGLVEMTRKRTRESLAHMLCEPCPVCQGKGQVKTARSVCYDILREILREARQFTPKEFRVIASASVVEMLLDEESQHLAALSDFIGKPISLRAEALSSPEQYDIVLM